MQNKDLAPIQETQSDPKPSAPIDAANSNEIRKKGEWLKPYHFKPGESGNPSGRPKSKPITEAYQRILTEQECDAIARAMLRQAKRGNVKATVEMTDRTEGKLTPLDDGDSGKPTIQVVVVNGVIRPHAPNSPT